MWLRLHTLKDNIYVDHFIRLVCISLHFLFVFPLGALSTEYWAKFIRKSSIGSWIKFDFLCIFLQVTSVWCPYSQSWDNTHFVMDYNMTGILTET